MYFTLLPKYCVIVKKLSQTLTNHLMAVHSVTIDFFSGAITLAHQRVATKDDYIYIPLKGPTRNETNTNNLNNTHNNVTRSESTKSYRTSSNVSNSDAGTSSSKPPLPKQPPRVVHASVKKDQHGSGDAEHRHRRRRTIDSSPSADGGRCPPMEPMGLIETDLDTEVTVITSGANVKSTRSLLDLGPQPRLSLAPQEEREASRRPHKSMEFLLDKENLKVVEVSSIELVLLAPTTQLKLYS